MKYDFSNMSYEDFKEIVILLSKYSHLAFRSRCLLRDYHRHVLGHKAKVMHTMVECETCGDIYIGDASILMMTTRMTDDQAREFWDVVVKENMKRIRNM